MITAVDMQTKRCDDNDTAEIPALPDDVWLSIFRQSPGYAWLFVSRHWYRLIQGLAVDWYQALVGPRLSSARPPALVADYHKWYVGCAQPAPRRHQRNFAVLFDALWHRRCYLGIEILRRYVERNRGQRLAWRHGHARDMRVMARTVTDIYTTKMLPICAVDDIVVVSGHGRRYGTLSDRHQYRPLRTVGNLLIAAVCGGDRSARLPLQSQVHLQKCERDVSDYITRSFNDDVYYDMAHSQFEYAFAQFYAIHIAPSELRPYRVNWLVYDEERLRLVGQVPLLYARDERASLVLVDYHCDTTTSVPDAAATRYYALRALLYRAILESAPYGVPIERVLALRLIATGGDAVASFDVTEMSLADHASVQDALLLQRQWIQKHDTTANQ
jgi:hypothetical protein